MKSYVGFRTHHDDTGRGEVVVNVLEPGKPPRLLNPRLDLRAHSPTGVEWGYLGSGPAQLALALATDILKDNDRALRIYQRLKFEIIGGLAEEGWTLTEARLWAVILSLEVELNDPSQFRPGSACGDCG